MKRAFSRSPGRFASTKKSEAEAGSTLRYKQILAITGRRVGGQLSKVIKPKKVCSNLRAATTGRALRTVDLARAEVVGGCTGSFRQSGFTVAARSHCWIHFSPAQHQRPARANLAIRGAGAPALPALTVADWRSGSSAACARLSGYTTRPRTMRRPHARALIRAQQAQSPALGRVRQSRRTYRYFSQVLSDF